MGRETMNQLKTKPMSYIVSTLLLVVSAMALGVNATLEDIQFLHYHNKVRLHAHLPPLRYDYKLAGWARMYALSRAHDCALKHSENGPYGENIFWGSASKTHTWTPKDAVKSWVKEHRYFDRRTNSCKDKKVCGHYTQIVWRDTSRVGCAKTKCDNNSTYVVCAYSPPGNFHGLSPFVKHNPFVYGAYN